MRRAKVVVCVGVLVEVVLVADFRAGDEFAGVLGGEVAVAFE
ncbi:hypothetical protein [Glutamicibacter protophormiae]|nr:hypothetical protein [Glutamicibacter protophormiae]